MSITDPSEGRPVDPDTGLPQEPPLNDPIEDAPRAPEEGGVGVDPDLTLDGSPSERDEDDRL